MYERRKRKAHSEIQQRAVQWSTLNKVELHFGTYSCKIMLFVWGTGEKNDSNCIWKLKKISCKYLKHMKYPNAGLFRGRGWWDPFCFYQTADLLEIMTNNHIDGSRCCVGSTCQEQGLKAEQLLVEPWHESRSSRLDVINVSSQQLGRWDMRKGKGCSNG